MSSPYNLAALTGLLAWLRAGGDKAARVDMTTWATRHPGYGVRMDTAGRAAVAGGWEPQWQERVHGRAEAFQCTKDGETLLIPAAARRELGVHSAEGHLLFGVYALPEEAEFSNAGALRFLEHLIERAESGQPSMTDDELYAWWCRFKTEHEGTA